MFLKNTAGFWMVLVPRCRGLPLDCLAVTSSDDWQTSSRSSCGTLTGGWETFSNIPTEGTVYISYKCAPEDRNFKAGLSGKEAAWHRKIMETHRNYVYMYPQQLLEFSSFSPLKWPEQAGQIKMCWPYFSNCVTLLPSTAALEKSERSTGLWLQVSHASVMDWSKFRTGQEKPLGDLQQVGLWCDREWGGYSNWFLSDFLSFHGGTWVPATLPWSSFLQRVYL